MQKYVIELRCDFLDKDKFKHLEEAAKTAAKHLYTQALLLQDKRAPQIALYGGDFFTSTEEICLADDIPQEEEGEDATTDQNPGTDE